MICVASWDAVGVFVNCLFHFFHAVFLMMIMLLFRVTSPLHRPAVTNDNLVLHRTFTHPGCCLCWLGWHKVSPPFFFPLPFFFSRRPLFSFRFSESYDHFDRRRGEFEEGVSVNYNVTLKQGLVRVDQVFHNFTCSSSGNRVLSFKASGSASLLKVGTLLSCNRTCGCRHAVTRELVDIVGSVVAVQYDEQDRVTVVLKEESPLSLFGDGSVKIHRNVRRQVPVRRIAKNATLTKPPPAMYFPKQIKNHQQKRGFLNGAGITFIQPFEGTRFLEGDKIKCVFSVDSNHVPTSGWYSSYWRLWIARESEINGFPDETQQTKYFLPGSLVAGQEKEFTFDVAVNASWTASAFYYIGADFVDVTSVDVAAQKYFNVRYFGDTAITAPVSGVSLKAGDQLSTSWEYKSPVVSGSQCRLQLRRSILLGVEVEAQWNVQASQSPALLYSSLPGTSTLPKVIFFFFFLFFFFLF